ncbi:MAG TPA: carbamate kinase [Jiangellales bacterium]|nr:carbamate kinase [Jiangellales bacterium]
MRVLIALGGNAMTSPDGRATPEDQAAAVRSACERVAELVAAGTEVVITHGNGPQVGNLLVKNEIAADVVPPVPLDWCGAQTQGTVGALVMDALEPALSRLGVGRRVATLVTRTLVDGDDPGFRRPTKPIGRYLPEAEARALQAHGQVWEERGERGWRRLVASPEPLEVLDAPAARVLVEAGMVVVAAGGGGVPTVRDVDGGLRGVEAVVDKDLAAVLLGRAVGADVLVVATDVPHAVLAWGTAGARPVGRVTVADLRRYADEGHFASGSMGPKVEAACRFVEQGGLHAVITSLDRIAAAAAGQAGTVVVPDP